MLFNSYAFVLLFFPLVWLGWWGVQHARARLLLLAVASYVFYGWWNWRFVPLMIVSTSADYLIARRLDTVVNTATRRILLVALLTFNLGLLALFKYFDFFATSLNGLGAALGVSSRIPLLHLILPIGISFYTFNSISYTIDVYRRRIRPTASFLEFAAFVAFFPHLIAGPIIRFADIGPQFENPPRRFDFAAGASGVVFFAIGLAKKIMVADVLAEAFVDPLFSRATHLSVLEAWIAALAYAQQIYFDFSGYSDMAVGLGLLLGFQLPQNFNSPYQSENISEFWRRWHISLSSWLRDYLFIPLGGSRDGARSTMRNLFIVMLLGGLWHGAAWPFVVWGLYHGVLLAGHALARANGVVPRSRAVNVFLTFLATLVGWVVFRATSLTDAMSILGTMLGRTGGHVATFNAATQFSVAPVATLALSLGIVFFARNSWELHVPRTRVNALILAAAVVWCVLLFAHPSPFLYFQF